MSRPSFARESRALLRVRLLDATAALTVGGGWSTVTMSAVADAVGVSRQTIYNEVGDKAALGEALVLRELDAVMVIATDELAAARDLVEAIRRAVEGVVVAASDNPLLKDVLSSAHGGRPSLLPWLTTDSGTLIDRAGEGLALALRGRPELDGLTATGLRRLVDVVVRLVLSHVVQPTTSAHEVAAQVAWVVERVVAPRVDEDD